MRKIKKWSDEGEIQALLAGGEQLYEARVRRFGVLGEEVGSLNKEIVIGVMNAVSDWAKKKGDVYNTVFCPAGYNHCNAGQLYRIKSIYYLVQRF